MGGDKALREHLLYLLKDGGAHLNFQDAVRDVQAELRGKRPKEGSHSLWELLEYMRIAQWDILRFCVDAEHESPEFPGGYWPASAAPLQEGDWEKCIQAFQADLEEMCRLVEDESIDLLARIPHGDGQTILREALLVADHNAYHMGQIVLTRKMLSAWE